MGCRIVVCVIIGVLPATRRRGRALIYGDSASDSSVVDDMERSAAAVAGESEGSGIDLCVFLSPSTGRPGNPESAVAVRR